MDIESMIATQVREAVSGEVDLTPDERAAIETEVLDRMQLLLDVGALAACGTAVEAVTIGADKARSLRAEG